MLLDGLRLFHLDLRGKTVLLKPNLVEHIAGAEVNTNPLLVGAAAEAFLEIGAKEVIVAEGPGHERDTYLVLSETGLESQLRPRHLRFVDLNRDEVVRLPLNTRFTGLDSLWLPRTVLNADFYRVDAEGEDASLGRRDAQLEKHVRHHAWRSLWLAQKRSPLERDQSQHP